MTEQTLIEQRVEEALKEYEGKLVDVRVGTRLRRMLCIGRFDEDLCLFMDSVEERLDTEKEIKGILELNVGHDGDGIFIVSSEAINRELTQYSLRRQDYQKAMELWGARKR